MRAGQPDWLFTSALISVKFEPVALIAASTNISLPTTASGCGKFASGAPPNSCARRASAPVKPAL